MSAGRRDSVIVSGQYSLLGSWVTTEGFLHGNQLIHKYGVEIEYWRADGISPILATNFHEVVYSATNGFVSYRGFSGYNINLGVQKEIPAELRKFNNVGAAFCCFNFDRFNYTQQYEVYPSVICRFGIENRSKIPFTLFLPIEYSFRQSGSYLSVGLTVQLGIKL